METITFGKGTMNQYLFSGQRPIPDVVSNIGVDTNLSNLRPLSFPYNRMNNYNQHQQSSFGPQMGASVGGPAFNNYFPKPQRYSPYYGRFYNQTQHYQNNITSCFAQQSSLNSSSLNANFGDHGKSSNFSHSNGNSAHNNSLTNGSNGHATFPLAANHSAGDSKDTITLQISNLDASIEEHHLRNYLLVQLKPITPVISLTIESPSLAKVKVPSQQFAKLVVAHLHRKKIGHKRMVVSYIRDPSSAESSALRCQVAGLLKDVPYYALPVYKFRELFQSRFKASISLLDLHRMPDICNIATDKNDEKYVSLQSELINTIQNNPLVESSQHSVPYCIYHFKHEQDKGWAEQEIAPLPSVMMSLSQIQSIIYSLLKTHKDDVPVASILHCIQSEININIQPNENGVCLEHLIGCIHGVQITNNNFGIKVLTWLGHEANGVKDQFDDASTNSGRYITKGNDSLAQISREVIELIKMSPKSIMKFNRFIPAYHHHFGKQCRVADYGYTRLIELFEALTSVVQVMGDGENRQITLTHHSQVRRFTTELLKILRGQANKSILLSQLPEVFSQSQNRPFDVTEYGVCDIYDILDGVVHNNSVVVTTAQDTPDMLISMLKRKQTPSELEKTAIFAGEVVELFKTAPQYSIEFKKFVRSYHYHFGYQCRLSDYGFLKLAELLESISGVVEMDAISDEDRKIYLSQKIAIRVFSEQLQEIIKYFSNENVSMSSLTNILKCHKNKYGYLLQPQSIGFPNILDAVKSVPFVKIYEKDNEVYLMSFLNDLSFRARSYAVCKIIAEAKEDTMALPAFCKVFAEKYSGCISEASLLDMKHAVKISDHPDGVKKITMTPMMKFVFSVINVLESRKKVSLDDLRIILNISFSTCFEYGYPNLSSFLNAFSDIFISCNNAGGINERSEIEMNPNGFLYTNDNRIIKPVDVSALDPCLSKLNLDDSKTFLAATSTPATTWSAKALHQPLQFCNPNVPLMQPKQVISKPLNYFGRNTAQANNAIQNKENFIYELENCNAGHPLFSRSSNNITNNSINHCNIIANTSVKLHERRNVQGLQYLRNRSEAENCLFNYAVDPLEKLALLRSFYEPPKPDTPPSRVIPFWLDPIWTNDSDMQNVESLNIPIPELKGLSVNLSPDTLRMLHPNNRS